MAWKAEQDVKTMKDAYTETMLALFAKDSRIMALNADLMNSDGTAAVQQQYPERVINVGVQEANMIGFGAGLALAGKIPFTHTFACFNGRRALDQIFISVAYSRLPVKIVGTDPGITSAFNGGTHMPFEDMGCMRTVPEMIIVEMVDQAMLENFLPKLTYVDKPVYIRLSRKETIKIYEPGTEFEIGRGKLIRHGQDATIVCSGLMVAESLEAANTLAEQGIDVQVVNIFCLKPLDRDLLLQCAQTTGAVVTAENHSVNNGLGSAVAEVLAEGCPVPMERVGVHDRFGEVGDVQYLKETFGMTADHIAAAVERVVKRKQERSSC